MLNNSGSKAIPAERLNPVTLGSALELRASGYVPVAGGTDLLIRRHSVQTAESHIPGQYGTIDTRPFFCTGRIAGFSDISLEGSRLSIGAGAVLTDIINSQHCPEILKQALLTIAAPGIRNIATLCGNVCNASPAADSLPVLYVLDAEIETAALMGPTVDASTETTAYNMIPVKDFITGPGKTFLKDNELVTNVIINLPPSGFGAGEYRSYFRKIGTRAANALAKLNAAAVWKIENGKYSDFRLAVGACGPKITRCPEAEKIISGRTVSEVEKSLDEICGIYEKALSPIDDQRSTSRYRKNTAVKLIRSIISDAGGAG